jgi:hypothetical protein
VAVAISVAVGVGHGVVVAVPVGKGVRAAVVVTTMASGALPGWDVLPDSAFGGGDGISEANTGDGCAITCLNTSPSSHTRPPLSSVATKTVAIIIRMIIAAGRPTLVRAGR